MTTISAVVFLYSPDTKVAAIAILNLDEAGEAGAAAACAMLITAASTVVTLLFMAVGALIDRRTQAWRRGARAERPSSETTNTETAMQRDAILLHPRSLTTTERTKQAMLRDWGSWDADFIAVTAELRRSCWRSSTARTRTSSCRSRAAAPSRSRRRWRRSCRGRPRAGARQRRLLQAHRQSCRR